MSVVAPPVPVAVTWHDAECGGYASDLPFWESLAEVCGDPILDLGAGTGRVSLHLASLGHRIVAVDSEPELADELEARADDRGLADLIEVVCDDVRELAMEHRFPLIVAPMQLLHMLDGEENRRRALDAVVRHLAPGGMFATAVLAEPLPPSGPTEPLPDVRDVEGWVHSSLPLEVRVDDQSLSIVRLRQLVAPDGGLTEDLHELTVDRLRPGVIEAESEAAGLAIVTAQPIPETDEHVGSLALIMERTDA